MYGNTSIKTATREVRYTVQPEPKEDYNNDGEITVEDRPFIQPGDDFGFSEEITFFQDGRNFSPTQQSDI